MRHFKKALDILVKAYQKNNDITEDEIILILTEKLNTLTRLNRKGI